MLTKSVYFFWRMRLTSASCCSWGWGLRAAFFTGRWLFELVRVVQIYGVTHLNQGRGWVPPDLWACCFRLRAETPRKGTLHCPRMSLTSVCLSCPRLTGTFSKDCGIRDSHVQQIWSFPDADQNSGWAEDPDPWKSATPVHVFFFQTPIRVWILKTISGDPRLRHGESSSIAAIRSLLTHFEHSNQWILVIIWLFSLFNYFLVF